MKKILLIMLGLFMAVTLTAQDRSIGTKTLGSTQTMYTYTGVAADTLTSNQDSIDIIFRLNKEYPAQMYILTEMDTIAGNDTLVNVIVYGRVFDTEAWTFIDSTTSHDVNLAVENVVTTVAQPSFTVTNTFVLDTSAYATVGLATGELYTGAGTQTFTGASIATYYREIRVIYVSTEKAGYGTEINSISLKLWRREF